ncbi:dethiobiotin synthase [Geosporobacter ferrireducens]|uniref:ATP-dependent dethiobiotin synthetase BioD n=1 Tax=Geosporobacter ferrireducens TaxID=1424294 RepID=A0A1D8GJ74_9FIRM|nr:dethiobiotin synthase [Geosporobacter ferrireducens]AOT70953.1 dethiobiotin synthase [Geosporobacter ferrireducens]MTI53667.1 dethiobiotin synthase [Geosporobacter ferrireducens]
MAKGIFILGTDTDVGKTVITAGLVHTLRSKGHHACSFKSVQSGGIDEGGKLISADTRFVKRVADFQEDDSLLNPYCLKTPVSPHLAARLEGIEIEKEKIFNAYNTLCQRYDFIVAEGSGGLMVPLLHKDYMIYHLIQDLGLPVIVVAKAGVGTINHTCLTVQAARHFGIGVKGIIINGYGGSAAEVDNIQMIQGFTGVTVLATIRKLENINVETGSMGELREEFDEKLSIEKLIVCMAEAKEVKSNA